MTETRTDRTDYLGLLALMVASANSEGWAFPYWNQIQIDAALNGLANALRDGTVPLQASATPPTLSLETGGGYLSAGQTLGVVQTFVDEWGRETDAGTEGTISTGTGIADPAAALTIGTPVTEGTGFEGGLLEVWYSFTDAYGGETLASPSAQIDLPYLATGLYSQVTVTLPATPLSVGAAGANIYIRHRSGLIVMGAVITDDEETDCLLDGDVYNCFRSLPLVNSTGSTRLIKITGVSAPSGTEYTRFYVRTTDHDWTDGDRRLRVGGVDEYDPATVVYPLEYTGATEEMAPGWPPPVSQVKAIRPTDLVDETVGILPVAQLPPETTLETELVKTSGEGVLSGFEVTANTPADMKVDLAAGEALLAAGRFAVTGVELTIPAADPTLNRIDIICLANDGAIEGPTENVALKGTPASDPVAPSTPAGYIKLAEIMVTAAATEITAGDISDSRMIVPTLVAAVLEFRAADADLADDLQDHIDDDEAHSSKPGTMTTVNQACPNSESTDFTVSDMPNALATEVLAVATSSGAIDYDLYFYSDSGRTVLQYQAGEGSGAGIQVATFRDRIPFEWFGGSTIYARVTNYSAADISNLALTIKYRK